MMMMMMMMMMMIMMKMIMIVIIFHSAINCFVEPGQFLGPDLLEGYFISWTEVNDLLQLIDVNSSRDLPKFRSILFLMSPSAPTITGTVSVFFPQLLLLLLLLLIEHNSRKPFLYSSFTPNSVKAALAIGHWAFIGIGNSE